MFDQSPVPRVFGVPPGTDFPQALVNGLRARLATAPPEAMSRITLYVNTRRMQRRLKTIFENSAPTFLPKLRLVTEIGIEDMAFDGVEPVSPLRRRLELSQLIAKLLDQRPEFAPRSSIFDLSDSLSDLLEEMEGEGIAPETLHQLDVSDQSGHWHRTLAFVQLITPFFSGDGPSKEGLYRKTVEALAARWAVAPPNDPILVAGSTGSRGATGLFMEAVARLPQGAVVLPGFDFDMTPTAWDKLDHRLAAEDHPQYRFASFAKKLDMTTSQVPPWSDDQPPNPARNKLISLSLRPVPVTDQWLIEGKDLGDMTAATDGTTLIEADSPRAEANAIALMLRQAAETGTPAALISPDRRIIRQVTAALDRWNILPDDSAGRLLVHSPPGRIFRQVGHILGRSFTPDTLLALLKHPLVATNGARGAHLLNTREFELWLRRKGPAFVTEKTLGDWASLRPAAQNWADWLAGLIEAIGKTEAAPLSELLEVHLSFVEQLCAWPQSHGSGALWDEADGEEAKKTIETLRREAVHGGVLTTSDYADLFDSVLRTGMVRVATGPHPNIMIWGTLEARVQGAKLVILAGLNEGSWPPSPRPDHWLNRALRDRAGLLLPEREIGLSAHDYQQAACAENVVLTRSIRDAESQTLPARWINRLYNLLEGLGDDGSKALRAMKARGDRWLDWAAQLERPSAPIPSAPRPSPAPPVDARPTEISITEVQRLIRDPYAIYARRILGLKPLDPLRRTPDAPLRGTLFHRILETYICQELTGDLDKDTHRLCQIADDVLQSDANWPAANRLWRARIEKLAAWFVTGEYQRRTKAHPAQLEANGHLMLPEIETKLTGQIDRIDLRDDAALAIYDYKTGTIPNKLVQQHFDKQLMLSALLAETGLVKGLTHRMVAEVAYIGLGTAPIFTPIRLEPGDIGQTREELVGLLAAYRSEKRGYTARRAVDKTSFQGDFDHLARFGEWDESDPPLRQEVG